MTMEKARNAGISLYPSEIANLRALASVRDSGSVPAFLRRVLAGGISAPVPTMAPDILDRLAHHYIPTEARALASHLANVDQPALLARLLRELVESIAAGIPADKLHVAGAHEISNAPIPFAALRYPPRTPRAPWRATYSEAIVPDDPQLNERAPVA